MRPASELRRQRAQDQAGVHERAAGARRSRRAASPRRSSIQGLLLNAGVPSLLQRSSGVGVRYMPGPCEVMVPEAGLQVAREALLQSDLSEEREG